jgi:hypothetical protein
MNGCGPICILFISSVFLWPLIVSSFYLIIKREQITSKGKYFLLSTSGGYILLVAFNFLIGLFARNFLAPDSVNMKILAIATTVILLIPPVVLSHVLYKKYS